MTGIIEVDGDTNNSNNNENGRLPNIKRWLQLEHEGLRCDILEVALAAGVACECVKLKDELTNQWKNMQWIVGQGKGCVS